MTTNGVNLTEGGNLIANADLSGKQFYALATTTTARKVDLAASATAGFMGILQNAPIAGEAAEVLFVGFSKAIIGTGGVTAGDLLQVEAASGKLITKTSTNTVVAKAMTTHSAGELGLVLVLPSPL